MTPHTCQFRPCGLAAEHYWEVKKDGEEGFIASGWYCRPHFMDAIMEHWKWGSMTMKMVVKAE